MFFQNTSLKRGFILQNSVWKESDLNLSLLNGANQETALQPVGFWIGEWCYSSSSLLPSPASRLIHLMNQVPAFEHSTYYRVCGGGE